MLETVLEAALYFAQQGIRVFPVKENEKNPGRLKWQDLASADPEQIRRWFENRRRNFGVVTDLLVVLDVDTLEHSHGEKDGPLELGRLEAVHGELPSTLRVRTATGGLHIYFRLPDDNEDTFTKGTDKLGPGLDVQTNNAYLVGPRSSINGKFYEVIELAPIAVLPAWMHELLKDKLIHKNKISASSNVPAVHNPKYVEAVIRGELARLDSLTELGWGGPAWDSTCFEVACILIEIANTPGSQYNQENAYSDFIEHAPSDQNFGPRQHDAKWRSALQKVGDAIRVIPVIGSKKEEEDLAVYNPKDAWDKARAPRPLAPDLGALEQALAVWCERRMPNWNKNSVVLSDFQQCIRLLKKVHNQESAVNWLAKTKEFMAQSIGVSA